MLDITAIEFQMSQEIQKLVTDIGQKDPHLKHTTVDDLMAKATAIADKMKGHGLSEDKYDTFVKTMDSKADHGVVPLFQYITNFAMAGAGQRVVRETVAGSVRRTAAIIHAMKDLPEKGDVVKSSKCVSADDGIYRISFDSGKSVDVLFDSPDSYRNKGHGGEDSSDEKC